MTVTTLPATLADTPIALRSFISASGRTVILTDPAGLERIAQEHEWLRDRVTRLELDNAMLRSVIETAPRPAVLCAAPV